MYQKWKICGEVEGFVQIDSYCSLIPEISLCSWYCPPLPPLGFLNKRYSIQPFFIAAHSLLYCNTICMPASWAWTSFRLRFCPSFFLPWSWSFRLRSTPWYRPPSRPAQWSARFSPGQWALSGPASSRPWPRISFRSWPRWLCPPWRTSASALAAITVLD